jgi:hypothetical protein
LTETTTRWSVGGLLLEALANRDFDRLSDCLATDARLRALTPSGLVECHGAVDVVEKLRFWFGGATELEVLDGTVGDVGGRVHVSWRIRMHPTPRGDDRWHVIEQQAYLVADQTISAIDLLCSGFQPETRHHTTGDTA